ncbi:MAG: hypothetical protein QG626_177 [Patescibacteria group bacterium]|jgi:hypothetical protein|nr:hypothetical protein [Patescibacteria group bacterium]
MRVQTAFEKIALVNNGYIFVASFVGLRLILAFACAFIAMNATLPWYFLFGLWGAAFALALGLCVRLAAFGLSVAVIIVFATRIGTSLSGEQLLIGIGLVLCLGLFIAGGGGHVFGLDGMVYRNIRERNLLSKLLFG